MASPQIEKGYTRIANEVLQALAQFRFTGAERSCMDVIMRMTWGYQIKKKKISYGTIARFTRLDRRTVIRAIDSLVTDHIVGKSNSFPNELWINKDYAMWASDRHVTKTSVRTTTRSSVTPTTTNKEIEKEIIKKKVDDFRKRDWGMN